MEPITAAVLTIAIVVGIVVVARMIRRARLKASQSLREEMNGGWIPQHERAARNRDSDDFASSRLDTAASTRRATSASAMDTAGGIAMTAMAFGTQSGSSCSSDSSSSSSSSSSYSDSGSSSCDSGSF